MPNCRKELNFRSIFSRNETVLKSKPRTRSFKKKLLLTNLERLQYLVTHIVTVQFFLNKNMAKVDDNMRNLTPFEKWVIIQSKTGKNRYRRFSRDEFANWGQFFILCIVFVTGKGWDEIWEDPPTGPPHPNCGNMVFVASRMKASLIY